MVAQLASARSALDTLSKNSVKELSCFGKPPRDCHVVCAAVWHLLRLGETQPSPDLISPPEWSECTQMMRSPGFLQSLQEFEMDRDPELIVRILQPYIDCPFFTVEELRRKSLACGSLVSWVIAVHQYCSI